MSTLYQHHDSMKHLSRRALARCQPVLSHLDDFIHSARAHVCGDLIPPLCSALRRRSTTSRLVNSLRSALWELARWMHVQTQNATFLFSSGTDKPSNAC